jgi:hypothetical protein
MFFRALIAFTVVLVLPGPAKAEQNALFTAGLQVSDTNRLLGVECTVWNVDFLQPSHQIGILIFDGNGNVQTQKAATSVDALRAEIADDIPTGTFSSNLDGQRFCMVTVDGAKDTVRVTMCLRDAAGRCQVAVEGH